VVAAVELRELSLLLPMVLLSPKMPPDIWRFQDRRGRQGRADRRREPNQNRADRGQLGS
jgi:hypothetical protein